MQSTSLTGAQRAYLRGLGQRLEPALKLGREGLTPTVVRELAQLLQSHELIKVRFLNADRDERAGLCARVAAEAACECLGSVGHTALFFRREPDAARRSIQLP